MMGSLVKEDLSVSFDEIEDPRLNRRKLYPLCEILFLALVGALLGVESWRGLELLGNERLNLLQRFFPFVHGIPSHQTIARVFSILRPKSFEEFFVAWMALANGSNDGKQIALDGKTLRGSYDKSTAKGALHLLNACAVDNGICLAQMEVDTKTNEIKVVPQMLNALDIKGAMISVDALNTQKDIAAQIIEAKAEYTLALKGNHKTLNEEVQAIFEAKTEEKPKAAVTESEKEHGRLTSWVYDIEPVDKYSLSQFGEWTGLKAVDRVRTTTLTTTSGKETQDTRYYLLSYVDVNRFAKSARAHWAVEAKLHWTLDVTFGEDASRKRKDHAPQNYSLVRKFGLNIIRTFKGKLSVPLFHIKMNANTEFMSSILQKAGFSPLANYSF